MYQNHFRSIIVTNSTICFFLGGGHRTGFWGARNWLGNYTDIPLAKSHQNSFFHTKYLKHFPRRGHSPLPDPTPTGRGHPSPELTLPSAPKAPRPSAFGVLVSAPSAPRCRPPLVFKFDHWCPVFRQCCYCALYFNYFVMCIHMVKFQKYLSVQLVVCKMTRVHEQCKPAPWTWPVDTGCLPTLIDVPFGNLWNFNSSSIQ